MRLAVALLFTAAAAVLADARAQPTVKIPDSGAVVSGYFQTSTNGHQVQVFQGIPYAEPRVGKQRFTQSKLLPVAKDLNATSHGSICYGNPRGDAASGQYPPSEDCLFLNVYAPASAKHQSKLPVMVWIHGGGFIAGAANPYNGTDLVGYGDNQVVVVTLNYRLGVFGFLANQELMDEGQGVNYGLRDQEIALQWVKKYIPSFGGNPEDVTIFGESAGGMSVQLHLLARDTKQQLFKKAISQSGYAFLDSLPATREKAKETIAKALGCATASIDCLRAADAATLFKIADPVTSWNPTVDGVFLLDTPTNLLAAGKFMKVPTIFGTNSDEFFSPAYANESQVDAFYASSYPKLSAAQRQRLKDLYPLSDFASPSFLVSEVTGDRAFHCPSQEYSKAFANANIEATFRYRFNYKVLTPFAPGIPLTVHAADLDFVFNRIYNPPAGLPNPTARQIAVYFMKFWTNFARFGNPNGPSVVQQSLLAWPTWDADKQQQIVLQEPLTTEKTGAHVGTQHAARCAFWAEVEPILNAPA